MTNAKDSSSYYNCINTMGISGNFFVTFSLLLLCPEILRVFSRVVSKWTFLFFCSLGKIVFLKGHALVQHMYWTPILYFYFHLFLFLCYSHPWIIDRIFGRFYYCFVAKGFLFLSLCWKFLRRRTITRHLTLGHCSGKEKKRFLILAQLYLCVCECVYVR